MATRPASRLRWIRPALGSAILAAMLAATPVPLLAQDETGKLEGVVRDAAGATLASAQIYIIGTSYSALTDPRGHYFINNIPPGSLTVRALLIGHRPVEVRDVRILAGHTATLDVALERAPFRLEEIKVVAADNPLVPRDEVTTKQRIDGEFLRELPVDDVFALVQLQPGVAAYTGSIRGGRPNEAVIYLDGVPISTVARAYGPGPGVATNTVQEASVTTGATSAEFGNAMSGVISVQTRSGGTKYSGAVSYETDEPFGSAHGPGINRVEASFGGPIARTLTFFLSGSLVANRSPAGGKGLEEAPIFVSAGVDTTVGVPIEPGNDNSDTSRVDIHRLAVARGRCDELRSSANAGIRTNYGLSCRGIRFPFNPSTGLTYQAKLSHTYGSGSRVTLTYLENRFYSRGTDYNDFYNLRASSGFRDRSRVATLEWSQSLARTPDRALALQTYLSYQQDRGEGSALTTESERSTRDPFGGFILGSLDLLFDFENFPLTDELVRDIREGRPDARVTPYDHATEEQLKLVDRYRNNAYGLRGWTDSGGPPGFLGLWLENRYVGRSILDWQVDRFNRLKLGGELIRYTIGRYDCCASAYLERPVYWNLFAEDRLDLGDLVLVAGLRLDAYASRAERDVVLDTVATNPQFGEYVDLQEPAPFGARDRSFQGRPLVVSRRDAPHGYLSPHVQVAFPVTDRTNIRFSYAHQVQAPDFRLILGGSGADIDFGQTIAFEFGARHAFGDDMVLDVALYNKDNRANPAMRRLLLNHPLTGIRQPYLFITNADYGNTRGIDVRLDRRIGRFFNGTIGYTYQSSKSTASDPLENPFRAARTIDALAGVINPPPQGILPTRFSRPHSLSGTVALTVPTDWRRGTVAGAILGDLALLATFLYASGTPYTPCLDVPGNEGVLAFENCSQTGPISQRGAVNSVRLPSLRQFDLRITKGFDLGRIRVTPYLDVRNLFDFTNVVNVFTVTGAITNPAHRAEKWTADSASYAEEAEASGVRLEDGSMDLRFSGAVASGCGRWVDAGANPAAPNCVYLIRAEERFGDGDHLFTLAEQRRASDALYSVGFGRHAFTGEPRRMRVGVEVAF